MIKYIPLFEFPILVVMVLIRSTILRHHGIRAIVFGATNKTDYILIPVILSFFYGLIASIFNLPFPDILIKSFFDILILDVLSIIICTLSLVWFGVTIKIFGKSFRVGIDENSTEKLIVNGTFAISRNPIYVGIIAFFAGVLLMYSNILIIVFLLFLIIIIHRQIRREEIFLKIHYGSEYEEYCKKVRRYI
jgi:protein-S-isoprenylcysteine O-methyltransferase Ste14